MVQEENPIYCENCEAEFTVTSNYDEVSYCPHCGTEIEYDEDLDEYYDELSDDLDTDEE